MKKYLTLKALTVTSVLVVLGGCATTPPVPQSYGRKLIVDIPNVGVASTAEIGETMISKAFLSKKPGIEIDAPVSDSPNPPGVTSIKSIRMPLSFTSDLGKYYSDRKATYKMLGAEVDASDRAGIFVPSEKSKPAAVYHYTTGYKYGELPILGVREIEIEEWFKDAYKRELIYAGISQNTISIIYREFLNDTARPAFTQDLKYDLSQGKEIGYKGSRFEVIKATNTEIQYKLIKPLN